LKYTQAAFTIKYSTYSFVQFQVPQDYKVEFPGMDTTASVVQSGRVAHASITFHH